VDGLFIDDEWSRRTISISLDALRRVPRVMAIAAGSTKVAAVLGALRSGVLHVIVTDRPTAEGVMRLADKLGVAAR
jgi:DNA-binding transcriptional regulator LsrR (DeoR family)